MKKFFKIICFLLLIPLSISIYFLADGYTFYKKALNELSVEDLVEKVKSKDNLYLLSQFQRCILMS